MAVIALVRLARLEGLVAIGILVGSNLSTWLLKNVLLTRPDLDLREIAPATLSSVRVRVRGRAASTLDEVLGSYGCGVR